MWTYDKKLQYPVKVKTTSPQMAKIIMTQLGGPDCVRDKACEQTTENLFICNNNKEPPRKHRLVREAFLCKKKESRG